MPRSQMRYELLRTPYERSSDNGNPGRPYMEKQGDSYEIIVRTNLCDSSIT